MSVTLTEIRSAAHRIANAAIRTPLVKLPLKGEVYAKTENLQKTGSFKYRGAYNFLASLNPDERRLGVVAHSSGNHAQAVALAAKSFGVPATLVIPEGAPEIKIRKTIEHGAKVLRCKNSRADRTRVAKEVVEATGQVLIPPFEHPWVIAGQGTVGIEIVEDLPEVSNVIVCVGGGGLIAGISTAVKSICPEAKVIGVEPELAGAAAQSFETGSPVEWPAEDVTRTIADGVRTQRVGDLNFSIIQDHVDGFVTVTEEEILQATRWYALEAHVMVEPTGALALAGYRMLLREIYPNLTLNPGPTVLLISGGNIEPKLMAKIIQS